MKIKTRILETELEIKVALDPYRMKIMLVYALEKKPLTVKQVADIMGEGPSKVHYHVKKLIGIDFLELDHTRNINGILAKYYTPTCMSFEISDDIPFKEAYEELTGNANLTQFNYVSSKMREDIINYQTTDFIMAKETLYMTKKESTEFIHKQEDLLLSYSKKEDTTIDKNKHDYSIQFTMLKITK